MFDQEILKKIDAYLAENKQVILDEVAQLVEIPSVSHKSDEFGKPFGEECAKALGAALEIGEKYGLTAQNYNNYCATLTMAGENPEQIGIIAHTDVVPATGEWHYDPFKVTYENGYMFGRGVADDKGPFIAALHAALCLKKIGLAPKHSLLFLLGGSEETGDDDIGYYLRSNPAPRFSFIPDTDFPVCCGEKGVIRCDLLSQPLDGNIVEMKGGTVKNSVADFAYVVLNDLTKEKLQGTIPDEFDLEDTEEGVKITAHGRGSHAAFPEGSVNAIYKLCDMLYKYDVVHGPQITAVKVIRDMLSDHYGKGLDIEMSDEPSGKLTHIGGMIDFQYKRLVLSVDIRYPVTVNDDDIMIRLIHRAFRSFFEIRNFTNTKPIYIPADQPEVKALNDVFNFVMGTNEGCYTTGGITYARQLPNAVGFGPRLLHGEPNPFQEQGRGGLHEPDECVKIDKFMETIKIYALSILKLDKIL